MYSFEGKVRYSEIGRNKKMTIGSVIDYFQDCSTFHSESVGIGLDYMEKESKMWILSSWQIDVNRFPGFSEKIKTGTWAYSFKNFYGYRNFIMQDKNVSNIIEANSVWVFMDLNTKRPVRLTKEEEEGYILEPKLEMEYLPRKIDIDTEFNNMEKIKVMRHQIDTNNHVNNGQYVKMAAEYLPDGYDIKRMRAEYKRAAVLGDIIYPKVGKITNGLAVSLCDGNDKPYAMVTFEQN